MLNEGKAFIEDAKSEVEGVVGQVKDTIETVTGLWAWAQGLWASLTGGSAPTKPAPILQSTTTVAELPQAKKSTKSKKQPERELICENLKVYFEAIRHLKAHCRELEEEALTTEKVADSAIDRIEMQWQMKELNAQLKQAMIYGTPEDLGLGAMYKEFLLKYDEILEEQEVARELKRKKERDESWQQERLKEIQTAKMMYALVVLVVMLEMTGLYFAL
jgi:hypothetical protein